MFTLIVLLNTAEKWLVVQGLIEICLFMTALRLIFCCMEQQPSII